MARPRKADEDKARNAGLVAYRKEIVAIQEVAAAKRFKTPFDYLRALVIADNHPKARGKIVPPRKIQPANQGPLASLRTPRRRPV